MKKSRGPKEGTVGLPTGIQWTPVDEALLKIKNCLEPKYLKKVISTADGESYFLAETVTALRDNPPMTNSAVDGYAFLFPKNANIKKLEILPEVVTPGKKWNGTVPNGKAVKILTGAPIPHGTDSVILSEDVPDGKLRFELPKRFKKGSNTRKSGEDKKCGDLLFPKERKLLSQDLALLSSTGVSKLKVYSKLNVGLLSTGDELVDTKRSADKHQIYDSNRPMLISKLRSWGYNVVDLGIVKDSMTQLKAKIKNNRSKLDLLVTTGGASSGDRDCVSHLLKTEGNLVVWRVAMKPGRPFAMGYINDLPIYALPGNPVAAITCSLIFLKPSLDFLAGGTFKEPSFFYLKANFDKEKKRGRTEFLRAKIDKCGMVEIFGSEGSGRISSLSWSDGLVRLDDSETNVKAGSFVKFLPYELF